MSDTFDAILIGKGINSLKKGIKVEYLKDSQATKVTLDIDDKETQFTISTKVLLTKKTIKTSSFIN